MDEKRLMITAQLPLGLIAIAQTKADASGVSLKETLQALIAKGVVIFGKSLFTVDSDKTIAENLKPWAGQEYSAPMDLNFERRTVIKARLLAGEFEMGISQGCTIYATLALNSDPQD